MKRIFFALLLLMPLVTDVHASGGGGGGGGGFSGGSFSGGGGGSRLKKVNTKLYDRGKAVFNGQFTPVRSASRSAQTSQARNLVQLRKRLAKKSERHAEKIDVRKWAGRMSANDFRSLKYYIDVQYLKKERYTRR